MRKNIINQKLCIILLVILLIGIFTIPVNGQGSSKILIKVNGKDLTTDVDPVIVESRTLIPARALFEELGAVVRWIPSSKEVIIEFNNVEVLLKINSNIAVVNKSNINLDVSAKIINSRTMIPLRFVSESFGFKVDWDGTKKLVTVTTNNKGLMSATKIESKYNMDVVSLFVEDYKEYKLKKMRTRNVFYIDFEETSLSPSIVGKGKQIINDEFIKSMEVYQHDYDTTRVYLETNKKQEVSILKTSKGIVLKVGDKSEISYKLNDKNLELTCENIWLYEKKDSLEKLYSISKSSDEKSLSIEFSNDLLNNLEEDVIEFENSFLTKIDIVNDTKDNKAKINFYSNDKIELVDTSTVNSSNTKFKINKVEEVIEQQLIDGYVHIDSKEEAGNSYVEIFGGDYSVFDIFRLTDPERIVIDIPNAKAKNEYGEIEIDNKYIKKIRYSQYQKNTVRVVLDLKIQGEYVATTKDGKIFVEIHNTAFDGIVYSNSNQRELIIDGVELKEAKNCKTKFDEAGTYYTISFSKELGEFKPGWLKIFDTYVEYIRVEDNGKENNISIKTSTKLDFEITVEGSKKTRIIMTIPKPVITKSHLVAIDAGHGGHDPGAQYKGVNEKDLNLDIAKRVNRILNIKGINTLMTRDTDVFIELYGRTDIANDANVDLFISIHNNAYFTSSNGTEVLYNSNKNDYGIGFTGKEFAQILQNNLIEYLGLYDRGVVDRTGLAVLKGADMPAALVEVGFITNDNDREKLITEVFREKAAEAICNGILEALEILEN